MVLVSLLEVDMLLEVEMVHFVALVLHLVVTPNQHHNVLIAFG